MKAKRRTRTTLGATLAVLVLATVSAAVAAPTAGAALVVCGGSEVATYSPGLTSTPAPTTVTTRTTYQPCVDALGLPLTRTAVASSTIGPVTRSCSDLLSPASGVRVIRWSTGSTSTFTFNATVATLAGGVIQILQQGSITDGDYRGSTAVGVVLIAQTDLDACTTTGVSSLGGPATLTIAL
jgi:hypothetical protein